MHNISDIILTLHLPIVSMTLLLSLCNWHSNV